ncbi:outer membrane protein transport protein [Pseudaeromonas sp. ZJS20]|uniref:outer membrane protein transport protein n=1 Tax=Pseudaeromonas aegiceratis TaxID=3153928 RepID=UPI00390C6B6B
MQNTKLATVALAVSVSLLTGGAQAAAFNLNEHSASGLGRAFAGEAAIADNAAVLARNPAAMTRFDRAEFSAAATYVSPNVDMQGNGDALGGLVSSSSLDANNVAPSAVIPAFYYIQPINERWAVGLGVFSNFGLSTKYDENYAAGALGGKTELTTYNINPNVAYRLNEQWSLGAGISAIHADASLIRRAGALSYLNSALSSDTAIVDLEGDTWAWNWNVGVLYEYNEANRFGLSYRSGSTLKLKGEYSGSTTGFAKVPGKLDLELPAIAEFSGYHLVNPQWALHYSVQWTDWSVLKELRATSDQCSGDCFQKDLEFHDSWRYAIGTSWYVAPQWTLRAGLALDRQAAYNIISIPDTERLWYSLGATYQINDDLSVDLGVAYLQGDDATIDESLTTGVDVSYASQADAWLSALQLNYRF